MSVLFETRLYPNRSDTSSSLLLASDKRILDYSDVERGWVTTDQLQRHLPKGSPPSVISADTRVIETMTVTHKGNTTCCKTFCLPVQ
jgi:hypothetical protein